MILVCDCFHVCSLSSSLIFYSPLNPQTRTSTVTKWNVVPNYVLKSRIKKIRLVALLVFFCIEIIIHSSAILGHKQEWYCWWKSYETWDIKHGIISISTGRISSINRRITTHYSHYPSWSTLIWDPSLVWEHRCASLTNAEAKSHATKGPPCRFTSLRAHSATSVDMI